MHIQRANNANALHNLVGLPLNEVHILCHAAASNPDGPAEPPQRSAAWRMESPVILLKSTGWNSGPRSDSGTKASRDTATGGGCFIFRTSSTVAGLSGEKSTGWSGDNTAPRSALERSRSAAFVLPANIDLEKMEARCSSDFAVLAQTSRWRCITLPSRMRLSTSP